MLWRCFQWAYLEAINLPFHQFIQNYLRSALSYHLVLYTSGRGLIVEDGFEGVACRWHHDGERGLKAD